MEMHIFIIIVISLFGSSWTASHSLKSGFEDAIETKTTDLEARPVGAIQTEMMKEWMKLKEQSKHKPWGSPLSESDGNGQSEYPTKSHELEKAQLQQNSTKKQYSNYPNRIADFEKLRLGKDHPLKTQPNVQVVQEDGESKTNESQQPTTKCPILNNLKILMKRRIVATVFIISSFVLALATAIYLNCRLKSDNYGPELPQSSFQFSSSCQMPKSSYVQISKKSSRQMTKRYSCPKFCACEGLRTYCRSLSWSPKTWWDEYGMWTPCPCFAAPKPSRRVVRNEKRFEVPKVIITEPQPDFASDSSSNLSNEDWEGVKLIIKSSSSNSSTLVQ